MVSGREVDKLVAMKPRPVQMQVLSLGLSRTSTMTMQAALNKLGYETYHMSAVGQGRQGQNRKERHIHCWREALNYKVNGIGKPYTGADFDKILQHYSAVTDMPCVNFSSELVTQFPSARVILSQRDPAAWMKSVENSIFRVLNWRIWPFLKWIDPQGLGVFIETCILAVADWTAPSPWTSRTALAAHMGTHTAHIRSIVPADNLLEFHPRDGWEPLCKFLDKPVPVGKDGKPEPFPYVNKGDSTARLFKFVIAIRLVKLAAPLAGVLGAGWFSWAVMARLGEGSAVLGARHFWEAVYRRLT